MFFVASANCQLARWVDYSVLCKLQKTIQRALNVFNQPNQFDECVHFPTPHADMTHMNSNGNHVLVAGIMKALLRNGNGVNKLYVNFCE